MCMGNCFSTSLSTHFQGKDILQPWLCSVTSLKGPLNRPRDPLFKASGLKGSAKQMSLVRRHSPATLAIRLVRRSRVLKGRIQTDFVPRSFPKECSD